MEFLLNRFRNLTVLLVVVMAQLLLLAYQVKGSQDVRLIRMWSVTAVTPIAKVLEVVRRNTIGVVEDYFVLINVREENRRLADELGKMKMENHFLKSELQTADRAQALRAFQARTPSRTIPARIIGTGTGANSRVVYVDRGSGAGIERGMAVVTPDGIVGKVLDSFPTASQVLLITDPSFAAGVISQKNRVHGTIKGLGQSKCLVDYVQNEEKVEPGEMFYTSGDDRIFPKGMPVGRVTVVRQGKTFKEIFVVPNGFQNGVEEVLIVVQGEHQAIPEQLETASSSNIYMMDPPKGSAATTGPAPSVLATDADRMREQYKEVGDAQGHQFGEGGPGSRPPNFNLRVEQPKPAGTTPVLPGPVAGAVAGAAASGLAAGTSTGVAPVGSGVGGQTGGTAPTTRLAPDGQPVVTRPKPAAVPTGFTGQATVPAAQTGAARVGPDGEPVVTRPKPAAAVSNGVAGQATTVPPTQTSAPVAPRPKPPTAVSNGATGQTGAPAAQTSAPVVPRPKPPAAVSNGATGQTGAPAAQTSAPVVPRPKPPAAVSNGATGQTGAPAAQTGSTVVTRPKPETQAAKSPVTVNPPPGSVPAPREQPQRRVTTNESTINVVTPAPRSTPTNGAASPSVPRTTGPTPPKPKPETRSEPAANQ